MVSAVAWACAALDLPASLLEQATVALAESAVAPVGLALEAHHDGSHRVDLTVLTSSAPESLITSAIALRAGLGHLLREGAGNQRRILEVHIDPAIFDVSTELRDMGIVDAAIADMVSLADRLPLQLEGESLQRVIFGHFLVTRTQSSSTPALTSHLLITSRPPPSLAEQRDEAVRREGRLWTDQVTWAARQLPLRREPAGVGAKMAAWQAAVDPHDVGVFATRLARDGLTPEAARTVFVPPPLAEVAEPSWWASFTRLVQALEHSDGPTVDAQVDSDETLRGTIPFAHLLAPIADVETARLTATPAEPMHPHVRRDLYRHLLARLSQIAAAPLSDVMWRDVPFGARLLAQAGAPAEHTGRDRYLSFCDHHRRTGLAEVLTEFPVLGRLLATLIDQWQHTSATMLARITRDRDVLAARFELSVDAPLTGVSVTAGDRHNDGNAVTLLRFGDRTVVYKPRSVHLEEIYAQAATALSRHSEGSALIAPAVLRRVDHLGDYGYVEFVEDQSCDSGELPAFYHNAGRLLALLHTLSATDCHHENLIAAGDQLVLIDAETLLMGTPADVVQVSTRFEANETPEPGSVLRVGMLPSWVWLDGRRRAIDASALGVPPGDGLQQGSGWRAINTDSMIRGEVSVPVVQPTSLPGQPCERQPVVHHVEDIVAGFTNAYRVLLDGRDSWLAEILARAESAHNRAVLRFTYVYASLLESLTAPDSLRSMAAGGMVCERLTRGYLHAAAGTTWPLVAAEQEALQRLDVPFFTWPLTGGTTRWHGGELVGWPENNQIDQVRTQLRNSNEADLRMQVALIRGSIRAATAHLGLASNSDVGTGAGGPAPTSQVLARRCFETTAAAALPVRGNVRWMGLSMLPDGVHANVAPIGVGLYDGRMGLAVSLVLWAQADPNAADQAMQLCRQTLAPVLEAIADVDGVHHQMVFSGCGLSGIGGLLRGLAFLRRHSLVDSEAIAEAQRSILDFLTPSLMIDDSRLDVMSGAAGLVAPLVRLLADEADGQDCGIPRQHLLDLIAASAHVLVTRQDADSGGWRIMAEAPPLTGLAHGASGMALALVEAAVALSDASLLPPALRGLAYEASVFDEAVGNWPDLRPDANWSQAAPRTTRGFMLGWCAGAPGIALSRLRLLQLLPEHEDAPQWRSELDCAADTTAKAPVTRQDHLCCGNLGRVVILRSLAVGLGESRWNGDVARITDGVRVAAGASVPRSILGDAIPDVPEPGLFTGLPGEGAALFSDADWVTRLLL